MTSEFRLILTGTFVNAADRDACYTALRSQITTYNTNNPGKLKRADMTRDDYFIADANATEKVV
jgi:hypothetical protein